MSRWFPPFLTLVALSAFWTTVALDGSSSMPTDLSPPQVVITAPVQLLLYGGDRFLAANIESIRATASATTMGAEDFRLRAHQSASRLNPCHEDNYWVGNASLSWGGAEEYGFDLLYNAMYCRYWDEWPAFFYAFNQYFFRQNIAEAQRLLEIAAQRTMTNVAAFRTFSTMLEIGKLDNVRMAMKMLKQEHDDSKDPKFREMIDKRIVRLNGLLTLRDAQTIYEERLGKPLTQPQELVDTGILKSFPVDPLGIGYEFRDHIFHLRQMNIPLPR